MKAKLEDRVRLYEDKDVSWPFDGKPMIYIKPICEHLHSPSIYLDPFPCYAHSKSLVLDIADLVERIFPMDINVTYSLLSHDSTDYTNGQATTYSAYFEGKSGPHEGSIILFGKRIPPHPAMTRYLVAHEYGHIVHRYIERAMNHDESAGEYSEFMKQYTKLKGIDINTLYGGRNWHTNTGEILVNDFRVYACNIEPEFYPHEPNKDHDKLIKFWKEMIDKYSYKQLKEPPS